MKIEKRYRWLWFGTLLLPLVLLMLCVSCSSDEEEEVPMLNIYVYAPDRLTMTRGENYNIAPTPEEEKIHNLQIWVFKNSDHTALVASLFLTEETELQGLNEAKSASYSIALTDKSFAQKPEPVDVYVMANVLNNNGTATYTSIINSEDLDAAVLNGGDFYSFWNNTGHKALTTIPAYKGVPMSGVARKRSVVNTNNVLHINDANLTMLRTVSKIRFVFSSMTEEKRLYIDKVELSQGMMYEKVRFFLDNEHPNYWVQGSTNSSWPVRLVDGDPVNPVAQNDDPTEFAISSAMTDEEYEALIKTGVTDGKLTEMGPVYLPESDKRLSGTVYYHLGSDGEQKTASFSMASGDFRRNQTWIVYGYYFGSSELLVKAVKVTDWVMGSEWERKIPNW